jgi:hypothetical protein
LFFLHISASVFRSAPLPVHRAFETVLYYKNNNNINKNILPAKYAIACEQTENAWTEVKVDKTVPRPRAVLRMNHFVGRLHNDVIHIHTYIYTCSLLLYGGKDETLNCRYKIILFTTPSNYIFRLKKKKTSEPHYRSYFFTTFFFFIIFSPVVSLII